MADAPTIDLVGHIEDLKREVEEAVEAAEAPEAPKDPKDSEHWTFVFDFTDSRGHRWVGQFTDKILSIRERQSAGILQAKLCAGQAYMTLPPEINELNRQLAHMSISLVERPKWAADLSKVADFRVIDRLYEKIAEHEEAYFRLAPDQREDPGADDGEGTD